MTNEFNKLNISDQLIKALEVEKITIPTEVQSETIKPILDGKDIIARADTGTGKTLAYLLPAIQKLDLSDQGLQLVILAPTYDLVMQIQRQIQSLIQNADLKLVSQAILGSGHMKRQIERLKKRPQIIVASLGRLIELVNKKKIKMHKVKTIVLDEVDNLLSNNNIENTKSVIKFTMKDRQVLAFSATVSNLIKEQLSEIMKEPEIIDLDSKKISSSKIKHKYIIAEKRKKIEILRKLTNKLSDFKAIVFINKSEEIDLFTEKLQYHNLKAICIHGETDKADREKAIRLFRTDKVNLLISSDVASRGLDFKNVSHIIHIDLPLNPMIYTHRVGRTARGNDEGVSIAILADYEVKLLESIANKLKIQIEKTTK